MRINSSVITLLRGVIVGKAIVKEVEYAVVQLVVNWAFHNLGAIRSVFSALGEFLWEL
ncbi:hypothetical protein BH23CYA1_BH23CYA1_18580 [soil metagenome]